MQRNILLPQADGLRDDVQLMGVWMGAGETEKAWEEHVGDRNE